MLIRRRLYHVEQVEDIGMVRGDIEAVEMQQPEGSRMELVIRFATWIPVGTVAWVADQLESLLGHVHRWPEEERVAKADGHALIIRWYKNPSWVAVIFAVLAGVIAGMMIVSVTLNRYDPVQQVVADNTGLWALFAGFILVIVGPSFFRALDTRYQERLAFREVQLRALEALERDR